jgi:glycosyltransferase involved in cell wall biosynthesis
MKYDLTVIIAAYNEAKSIKHILDQILKKEIENINLKIIIVESKSNDGTREIVQDYANKYQDKIKAIYQDKPLGKGNAVREGLACVKKGFVLFQDADDEYDVDDYEPLLLPLIEGRANFVLGSRHASGNWNMREFKDQPFRAFLLNCGHWFFTYLINIIYLVNLRDPFTMYKVFKIECINGISFECDRFDFDHEFVIKLIRTGNIPIEIPVKYKSRSFAEGKKVRIFQDPLTWIKAIIKYRFVRIK